jgi:hypothetical protein
MTFTKRKIVFIVVAVLLAVFVLASSLRMFSEDPGYVIVPHGNHNHYVPHDRDESVPLHNFPQRPPREGERITPDGRFERDPNVPAPTNR